MQNNQIRAKVKPVARGTTMDDLTSTSPAQKRHLRDWLDPLRLYDPRLPAGRWVFFWGLALFPLALMFVLLTAIIIVFETVFSGFSSDYLGIIIMCFMLAWVAAAVAITRRRLLQLGRSQNWVWLAIFPIINLALFTYLMLKPGPIANAGEISH
jgi:hypothetical protein